MLISACCGVSPWRLASVIDCTGICSQCREWTDFEDDEEDLDEELNTEQSPIKSQGESKWDA